jgi:hypothetical protein
MLNGASPLMFNQGTNAGKQKSFYQPLSGTSTSLGISRRQGCTNPLKLFLELWVHRTRYLH